MVVLAVAALTLATLTFTNVTYWLINATLPPAMKYAGGDVNVAGGRYVKVSYYFDQEKGYNITRISVVGFTGDPVNYTDVIRVCNRQDFPITAKLQYKGVVSGNYHSYVHSFYVYWNGTNSGVGVIGGTTYSQSDPVTIPAGGCRTAAVYILIKPDLPEAARDGRTVLATYQVDIAMSPT